MEKMNRSWIAKRIAFISVLYLASFYFYAQYETSLFDIEYKTAGIQAKKQKDTEDFNETETSIEVTSSQPAQVSCSPLIDKALQDTFIFDNVAYPRYVPQSLNKSLNFTCMNKNTPPKVFLFWNKLNRRDDFRFGLGKDIFKKLGCPATNCEATNDRSRINESSLVFFSLWDKIGKLPKWRAPEQRWVFVVYESVYKMAKFKKGFIRYNGLFNLSSTSSINSDTIHGYISFWNAKWGLNNDFDVNKNFMENKTGMAFQLTSNCKPPSGRHIYIAELKNHIQADIYGECGKPCPNKKDEWLSAGCLELLISQYKFYLSFENSICEEYITEKFLRILNYDIIPVVFGGGSYEKFVPKSGYINVFDFESPTHLAEYMTKVATNETLYNSYFQWKQFIKPITNPIIHPICELCIKLNLEHYYGVKHSVIEDMNAYWNKAKECKSFNRATFKLQ